MRSILELLKILETEFSIKQWKHQGLCAATNRLNLVDIFSYEERNKMNNYIKDNRPFYKHNTVYGWKPYRKWGRKRWLKKHIKLNS